MVVMSGEVSCCLGSVGFRVCSVVFRTRWVELVRMSSITSPLVVGSWFEFHNLAWALKSPVMMQFLREVRWLRQLLMVCFSVA